MQHNLTVARAYATAIFKISVQHKSFENWKILLIKLSEMSQSQHINNFFHVIYSVDIILKIIITACCNIKIDQYGKNLITLLILNKRLYLLEQICNQFIMLYNDYYNIINIEITTTHDLNTEQKKKISIFLKNRFNKKINLICRIDSSILHGVILRYHDMVIDNCVLSRFSELSNFLIS
ncbi:ATP synthase subunit delta [Buchnera aphidicola (Takecallis arundicolens)]|uniref:F0F1 ATP synthase subunit delta n=1 Tax=Buchnera aphidicola TaxID=9 RepID=UPI0034644620